MVIVGGLVWLKQLFVPEPDGDSICFESRTPASRESGLVAFLGYEWTAVRSRGGHHNVLFRTPGHGRVPVQVGAVFPLERNGREPPVAAVEEILEAIGLAPNGKPWDCGACGFKTCRAFAGAFIKGRAALKQCPPYQERLAVEAQREAAVDALTGLVTYRVLRDRLTNELARSGRSGDAFAVLFLDLDGFKQVNDTYGHRAGSEVLAAVGQVLLKAVRSTDVGGAMRVAEVIRERISAVGRALGYDAGLIAASIGVAECDPRHATGGDVLERADRALYRAKAAGGNRIEV